MCATLAWLNFSNFGNRLSFAINISFSTLIFTRYFLVIMVMSKNLAFQSYDITLRNVAQY